MSVIRIGVDVGGTNTDAAVVRTGEGRVEVLGTAKRNTTPDVLTGARASIAAALEAANVPLREVSAVICGTTHFINALLIRHGLVEVGVLRLCLPSGRELPPFADLPEGLAAALGRHYRLLPGGVEHDGEPIAMLDEVATRRAAVEMVKAGARSLVVSQVFAPVRREQEEEAARWVREELEKEGYDVFAGSQVDSKERSKPVVDVTTCAEVGGIGLLERENAAVLNACLRPLARQVAGALASLGREAGLQCPVLLTQNDGSVSDIVAAAGLPIRCVQSGPVNSAVGAYHLSGAKDCIFLDIGGTTSEVGQLINGLPRPSNRDAFIAKARTNYVMPDVYSVPLGGGTVIGESGAVGPGSVGKALRSEARCFGGSQLTSTCVAMALGKANVECPQPNAAAGHDLEGCWAKMQEILAQAVETQRTSDARVTVVVVGGAAFLCEGAGLENADVVVPPHQDCANAVGAACARVSAAVDVVEAVTSETRESVLARVRAMAVAKAEAAGAEPGSVEIAALEEVPVAYMPGGPTRIKVKALGRLAARPPAASVVDCAPQELQEADQPTAADLLRLSAAAAEEGEEGMMVPEQPVVKDGAWEVSAADIEALALGVGVLGCGGGGSPYQASVRLQVLLAQGKQARIVHMDLAPEGDVLGGGYIGAPTSAAEVLPSSEVLAAQAAVCTTPASFIAPEIGGGNGLEPLVLSALTGKVTLDADYMGRAFPEVQMQTPCFHGLATTPTAISDKHGSVVVVQNARSVEQIEAYLRPIVAQMGMSAAIAERPLSLQEARQVAIPNTLSQAWHMGRGILAARRDHADPVQAVLTAYPGGKMLLEGKVADLRTETAEGFARGFVRLRGSEGELELEFQNEFLVARRGGGELLGSVPDLLCLVETATGRPIATEEVRYGLRVSLLCLPAPPQLRTEAALKYVGPASFGYGDINYRPVGDYVPPTAVSLPAP